MEELYELRAYIESGQYKEALLLLDEMEEMSRDDKINRISSFMEVLLVHLIKQAAEQRTTRSWDVSIRVVNDPGLWKRQFMSHGRLIRVPVEVALVATPAQPVPPGPPGMLKDHCQRRKTTSFRPLTVL